jgi:hypothetical protein
MAKMSFMERLRGKRTKDIRLPNDTGDRDRRLPKSTPVEDVRRGLDSLRGLVKASESANKAREKR